jgi:hypothetical protein
MASPRGRGGAGADHGLLAPGATTRHGGRTYSLRRGVDMVQMRDQALHLVADGREKRQHLALPPRSEPGVPVAPGEPATVAAGQPERLRECRNSGIGGELQPALDHWCRRVGVLGVPGRGAIDHSGRALVAVALGPLGRGAPRDVEELSCPCGWPAVIDDQPRQPQSMLRGQCRVSVSHEGLLVWRGS